MSIEITYSEPNFDEVVAETTHKFELNGRPITVIAKTGMINRADDAPQTIVAFKGAVFKSADRTETIGEYAAYQRENILRNNRPPLFDKIMASLGGGKPKSVEELFYRFMSALGDEAGFKISKSEVADAFETIANDLIEQDGFSKKKGEGNWKPYSRVWEDRRWLDSVQNK